MTRRTVRVCLAVCVTSACGDSSPVAPSTASPGPALVTLDVGLGDGQVPGQGTGAAFTLTGAAPANGTLVTVSSSNPAAATVPASVTAAPGSAAGVVPVLTHSVSSDVVVTITASAGGATRSGQMSLAAGTFLSFSSPTGDSIGLGRSRRYGAADYPFTATIDSTLRTVSIIVSARLSTSFWHLILQAPPGEELRPGTYTNALRASFSGSQAGLDFSGFGRGCNTLSGSFVILDALYTGLPGVERFFATFTQSCDGGPPLTGEVRIVP